MTWFVRLLPGTPQPAVEAVQARGAVVVGDRAPEGWSVVGDVAELTAAARRGDALWLRGLEAGGPVGACTALVLIRAAAATGRPWVAEGLGLRAMAAALACGAAGVVLDVHLWRASEAPVHPAHREVLAASNTSRDTAVLGEPGLQGLRVATRSVPAVRRRAASVEAPPPPIPARWFADPDAPVPASQCVAEANRFPDRALGDALDAWQQAVAGLVATARAHHPLRSDPVGAGTPIVQGPMANVAEEPGLAGAVHAAGAMPFVALGALAPPRAREVLGGMVDARLRPWGVGVIGFDVMPHRDAHLDAIAELGSDAPDAVIVAGGTPALALSMQRRGVAVWLHTPSGRLVAQALDHGVRAVVLEGHEAGGHVGQLTSVGLWEEGLAQIEARAADEPLVVLAGGIGDAVSGAFAGAMAAEAHRRGARVALQAGTAFFFTHEIVEHGQITPSYQTAALDCVDTVLVGASVNLPLRCAPNAFTDAARADERAWETEGVPRAARRQRLEHHNLGRTRLAAKGIERHPDWGMRPDAPHYRDVDRTRQIADGAYTMGQGATVTRSVHTVAEVVATLHRDAAGLLEGHGPSPARYAPPRVVRATVPASVGRIDRGAHDIAIVGLGCVLPGAPDVPSFWRQLLEGRDAVRAIDPDRWEEARYFDAEAGASGPARSYSRHAGQVQPLAFDPLAFRIPPASVPTIDPSQRLALMAAAEAVTMAGWQRPGAVDAQRAAVVLGNAMGGQFAKDSAVRIRFQEVLRALEADELAAGWSVGDLRGLEARVEERLASRLPPATVDSMAGLLSNVVAGRVAAWLDWMGGNLTVDAACAASLAAVAVAVEWLRSGRCDAVLAGGIDTDLAPETYVGFCRTEALSRAGSSPFSARADGFVMGEGGAVFALKRLDDALRDDDAVWAVIRGVGQSSDGRGRGITAPRAEGQQLAIERASEQAGFGLPDVHLIEAHGTGTALGDATEVGVLSQRVGPARAEPVWLGSVKSGIGHLKSAAGAAGLLKATLAAHHRVVPPTLHAAPLRPEASQNPGLQLPRAAVPLTGRVRAGVSAFGFGGTNFHVLLQSAPDLARIPAPLPGAVAAPVADPAWRPDDTPALLLCFGAHDRAALAVAVAGDRPSTDVGAPWRCAVVADPAQRTDTLARVARWLDTAAPGDALGIEAFVDEGPPRPVIVAAPGQGAQRPGTFEVVSCWPGSAEVLAPLSEAVERATGQPLTTLAAPDRHDPLALHATLFVAAAAWVGVLRGAGVGIGGALGHSLGAFGALVAAGRADAVGLLPAVLARGAALADCPAGAMVAVRLPAAEAAVQAAALGLAVAAVNGPEQGVLAGAPERVDAAVATLGPSVARRLPVERAYHTASVQPAADRLADALRDVRWTDGAPCWSTRTGAPVDDAAADLVASVVEPVDFAGALATVARAQPRALVVEVGPGSTLTALARRAGLRAVALDPEPLDRGRRSVAAAAALWAAGHPGLVDALPGTLARRALPAPSARQAVPRAALHRAAHRTPAQPDPALAARARAVQDLRIAALADPALAERYELARSSLLADLAAVDVGGFGVAAAPLPQAAAVRPEPPAAPVEPAAPPPTAPEPVAAALRVLDDLEQTVLDAVCEVTGYPPDFVEPDADLEADLGVDSIRKMEILGLLEQRLGFTTAESDYATLAEADLRTLVAHIRHRMHAGNAPSVSPAPIDTAVWLGTRVPIALPPAVAGSAPERVWRADGEPPDDAVGAWQALARVTPRPAHLGVVARTDDAGSAAAAGFARSLAREWDLPLRVVTAAPEAPDDAVLRELSAPGRPDEVQLDAAGTAWAPTLVPLRPSPDPAALPHGAVWVVTGGGTGIVAPCLLALASTGARVLLLGRTDPLDDGPRSEQLARALSGLREAGLDLTYAVCDVTDAPAVTVAVDLHRARWGRIDAVLHGAGVLADRLAHETTDADRAAVLGAKVQGAAHLIAATRDDTLALWCAFGSVVAYRGNAGQSLYGAANAALEVMRHPRARRHLTLAFTAWSGVGMASDPVLLAALARRGVPALTPDRGAEAFRRVVYSDAQGTVAVTAGPPAEARSPAWPLADVAATRAAELTLRVPLDPSHPALADHRVAGKPLVPAALWLCAMLAAVRWLAPGHDSWSVARFEVLAPTFVERVRDDVVVAISHDAGRWTIEVRTADAVVATAALEVSEGHEQVAPPTPLLRSESAEALYRPDLLFHGPSWRVLSRVHTDGNGRAEADLLQGPMPALAGAVDGAHQLLSAWSGRATGTLGLPVGAARWVVDADGDGPLRVETVAITEGKTVLADVIAVDRTGRVVLRGEGVRLQAAGRAPEPGDG